MKTQQRKNSNSLYRIISMFLFLTSFPLFVAAQMEIRGKVTDSTGEAVIAATVTVKDTHIGTLTDINGMYTLSIPADARTVVFSFLGMEPQEVSISRNQQVYNVVLYEDAVSMEEVVVIGYGTIQKRDLTGSVSSMTGRSLTSIPIANTETALTGRMAGVRVTTSDGAPDAEVQIRVRGGGSITQDNNPLYIVDGFPVDRISDIATADIESIDVLKDASSTAIYGARGANGVVIITTKSAKAGKTTVSYNAHAQLKKSTKTYDVLDPYEFVNLQYELNYIKYAGEVESFIKMFGEVDDFDIYKDIKGRDSQNEMYGREAWGQSHNVSITGGSDKTKFTGSMTYLNEDGVLLNSSFKRLNLNFKLSHQIANNLKFDISTYYSDATTMGAGTSNNTATEIKNAVSFRPVTGKNSLIGGIIDDPDLYDDLETQSELYDPIDLINQDYKKQKRTELNTNAALTWNIAKMFTFKGEFGFQSSDRKTNRFYGPLTYMARTNSGLPVAQITTQERPRWRTAQTLNYRLKNYKKLHDVNVLIGFEATSESQRSIQSVSRLLPSDILPEDAFARMQFGSAEYTTTLDEPDNRLASFFGRANYTFKDRYLFTVTLRADGSSKFAPGNQWGLFPSGAIAWRVSEESFLKNVEFLDDLKLRLSYGQAGNNRIANDMWRRTYTGTISSPIVGIGNVPNLYYKKTSSILINPDLKWETTITRDLGVDFALFNGKLNGTVDIYKNTTKDLLLQSVIPEHTGYAYQQQNIGQTSNKGVELTLNAHIVQTRDFSLSLGFNIAANRNRVDKLNEGINSTFYRSDWADGLRETDDFILRVGEPVGQMYGYVTDGFYTVDDYYIGDDGKWYLNPGVANSQPITDSHWTVNMGAGMPNPGSLKLKKTTEYDPDDPESCLVTTDDRQVIGNANPKHTGGFNVTGVYKNFDLSLYFNWVYGNDVYNANKILFTTQWKKNYYNMLTIVDSNNRFRHMNDAGEIVRDAETLKAMNENATIWSPAMKVPVLHSWAIEDGSFLRLSNITVGYTLPKRWTTKIQMTQCRFYFTMTNVFTWTKYSGFDPEVNTRTNTPLTPGVDYSSYPKAHTFTLGTNITF